MRTKSKRYKTKGWSNERRKKQAGNCRKNKPWEHSTGAKTPEGRETSKMNGLKHSLRTAPTREFIKLLRQQRNFIKSITPPNME